MTGKLNTGKESRLSNGELRMLHARVVVKAHGATVIDATVLQLLIAARLSPEALTHDLGCPACGVTIELIPAPAL